MTRRQSLALVIVGYDSEAVLKGFFDSLRQSSVMPSHIIMVENSPVLPKLEAMKGLPIKVLHRPDNPGYGAAVNFAIATLPAVVTEVVVCNPDITIDPEAIETLLANMENFDRTAICGPAIFDAKGDLYPSARAIPGIRIGIGHALLGQAWPRNPWTRRYLGDYERSETRVVGWLSGSFFVVSRKAFDEIGGFDENYFMFFEDVDLGFRLKTWGYRSVYVPSARITHVGAHSTSTRMKSMIKAHHRSAERFLSKLYPGRLRAPLRAALNLGLRIRAALASFRFKQ